MMDKKIVRCSHLPQGHSHFVHRVLHGIGQIFRHHVDALLDRFLRGLGDVFGLGVCRKQAKLRAWSGLGIRAPKRNPKKHPKL